MSHDTVSVFNEAMWDETVVMYYPEHGPGKEKRNTAAKAGAAAIALGPAVTPPVSPDATTEAQA